VQPESTETLAHEHSNIDARAIVKFAIWFVASTIVVVLLVLWLYRTFVSHETSFDVQTSAVAHDRPAPPEPRLQPTANYHNTLDQQDMAAMLMRENDEFARRGWWDERAQKIVIPEAIVAQVTQMSSNRSTTQPAPQQGAGTSR